MALCALVLEMCRVLRFSFSFKDVHSINKSLHLFHLADLTSRDIACKDIVVIVVEVVKKKKIVKSTSWFV